MTFRGSLAVWRLSPPTLVILFVLSASLSVFGLAGWKSWSAREATLARSAKDTQNLSHSLAQHASRTIEAIDLVLQGVVERLANGGWAPQQGDRINRLLTARAAALPQVRELVVLDTTGRWKYASFTPLPTHSNSDRDYFKFHRDHDDPILSISEPLKSRAAGRWSIILSRRANDSAGKFAGVVVATIDLEYFQEFYNALDLGPHGAISIFRDNGTLLVRRPFSEDNMGRDFSTSNFFRDHFALAPTGYYRAASAFDGKTKWTAYEHLPEFPIVVSVTVAEEDILAGWRATVGKDLLLAAAVSGILGLMGIFVAAQLRRRMRAEATLRRSEAEATAARKQAERAAAAQGQFLATMSHELRTPLNSVLGFADILLDRKDLDPEVRRQVGLIQTAGAFLLTTVNDVLDFSKIEEGKLELAPAAFSLPALIDNSISVVRDLAAKKNLGLTVQSDPDIPSYVLGDEARLRQVLLNLLNNAIKFTQTGGITLGITHQGTHRGEERLHFAVSDTGIGIPQDRLDRLFRRFSQVDGSTSREFGGSGLGLAICKRLVEMMGGEIGVASQAGMGSTFWFTVSLPPADAPERDVSLEHAMTPGLPSCHILVVEDVDVNQEIVRSFLEAAGHQVHVVGDGADAIAAVQADTYDLILMDIQMPVMDGVTATRHIRALAGPVANTPIIAMTANVLPQQVESFRAAGMDGHVAKPLRRDDLLAAIARCIQAVGDLGDAAADAEKWPVLDEETFADVTAALGNEKAKDLLDRLRVQMAVSFRTALDGAEARRELGKEAHKLISMAGTFGFLSLSKACAAVELAALDDAVNIQAAVNAAQTECQKALSEIAARFAKGAGLKKTA